MPLTWKERADDHGMVPGLPPHTPRTASTAQGEVFNMEWEPPARSQAGAGPELIKEIPHRRPSS